MLGPAGPNQAILCCILYASVDSVVVFALFLKGMVPILETFSQIGLAGKLLVLREQHWKACGAQSLTSMNLLGQVNGGSE